MKQSPAARILTGGASESDKSRCLCRRLVCTFYPRIRKMSDFFLGSEVRFSRVSWSGNCHTLKTCIGDYKRVESIDA